MKIERLETSLSSLPLKRPFITALRTVKEAHFLILLLHGSDGSVGIGSAPPTAVITGETLGSIEAALKQHIGPAILGMDVEVLDPVLDLERVRRIRDAIGPGIRLRIIANQGWTPKEAVRCIHAMEDAGLDLEWVEQPVHALDLEGLRTARNLSGCRLDQDSDPIRL